MILAGTPLGFEFAVLAQDAGDPAVRLAGEAIVAPLTDDAAITRLASLCDVITVEIEHVGVATLRRLRDRGMPVHPDPDALGVINDKLVQKERLAVAGIPVPAFGVDPTGYPTVQKLRAGGYDGRGVKVLGSPGDKPLAGPSYYEELVEIRHELAVLVARSPSGEERVYPVVEMAFDPKANICSRVIMPARVDGRTAERATQAGLAAVRALKLVGVAAVELFVSADGEVLVNELAPRPHNSGHLTIEACETSQFEQHLRAIADLPLGPTTLLAPAVMLNLLGAPDLGDRRVPYWPGVRDLLRAAGPPAALHLHWYGKREVRPYRKMGHLTVTADRLDAALEAAERAEPWCSIGGTHE